MILQVQHNKYCYKAKIKEIKTSKNKEFFIWSFKVEGGEDIVGFTPTTIYFGSKTHLWYSIIVGYFLPHSYNINFDNILGKDCYVCTDTKRIVRNIVPCQGPEVTTKEKVILEEVKKPIAPPIVIIEEGAEEPVDESLFS